jgi:hypothetical protein
MTKGANYQCVFAVIQTMAIQVCFSGSSSNSHQGNMPHVIINPSFKLFNHSSESSMRQLVAILDHLTRIFQTVFLNSNTDHQ